VKSPVIRNVVEKDLCIGCGLCVAICPKNTLAIEWNRFGEYNPIEVIPCETECGLCLKVCPFADGNDNEDTIGKILYGNIPGISYSPETGYFLDSYVGYAPDTREHGASGGMATWFLSTLLKKGIVDYVIAVVPNNDPDQLFKFTILSDPESVLSSSGSAYYPVELSGIIREIQARPGKCAIIGLPCYIKAIRLAAQRNKKLNERIFITAGLVCGQLKNKQYSTYLANLAGILNTPVKIIFREKNLDQPATNYSFHCIDKNGKQGKILSFEGMGELWHNRWFTINACNYCDDIFSECADVTFMDAWLPEYWDDPLGTNFILVRSQLIQQMIEDAEALEIISIKKIPIDEIIRGQIDVINMKRHFLGVRQFYLSFGRIPIKKRTFPLIIANPLQILRQKLIINMQKKSKTAFIECISFDSFDIKKFKNLFRKDVTSLKRLDKIIRIIKNPLILAKKIRNAIEG
jgi:coenzyme F420-reducing hydrogenase beta subunit